MTTTLMERVFRIGDSKPYEVSPSGHKAWLLAQVGNISAIICESSREVNISFPFHEEEEFVYVLDGQLTYDDGRAPKAGEAVYNLPKTGHAGKYIGRLLRVMAYPETDVSSLSRNMMSTIIREKDADILIDSLNNTTRKVWLLTETLSVSMNDSQPGSRFVDPGHPEKEIIYVIQGQLEYANGRVVTDGEAIINLPDMPHPGKRTGRRAIRTLEIKSPCSSRLLEMLNK